MADVLERLLRELRLDRSHERARRLARRVRDDVQLDGPGRRSRARTLRVRLRTHASHRRGHDGQDRLALPRRGFVFPSSEIYGGLGSAYDYGHYGVLLKDNVKARWLEAMVQERDDIVALDSSIILHPRSGRRPATSAASPTRSSTAAPASSASAPITSTTRARGAPLRQAAEQAARRDARLRPDRGAPVQPHVRDARRRGRGDGRRRLPPARDGAGHLHQLQERRPVARRKPPFGIAQIGKSFRNEITPGNFLFRTLEFEQMEMEFFVPPAEADAWYRYWIEERRAWYLRSASARATCASARTRPTSSRTTRAARATSSTSSRSAGRSSRGSRTAATST